MKTTRRIAIASAAAIKLTGQQNVPEKGSPAESMPLGQFSVSLAVKDIKASRAFYEALGFQKISGDGQRFLILRNGDAVVGLFQGLFPKNTLTFNPKDARKIQRVLKARGMKIDKEADPNGTGPAFLALTDPDGNPILIDQHGETA